MARERFDDDLDDRDDDRRGDRPYPARRYDRAGAGSGLKLPGLFLVLLGLVGSLVSIAMVYTSTQPQDQLVAKMYDGFLIPMIESQPDSQAKTDQLAELRAEREKAIAKAAAQPAWKPLASSGANLLGSILMLVGGLNMRGRTSYPLSMAGAIVALVPVVNGCICFAMPFGLWALIALNGRGVRQSFARPGNTPPRADLADDLDR